jgi:hypothetical protein
MRRELPTKYQRKQLAEIKRRTGMAIATYRKAWLDLIRIGVVLLDADLDLAGLKKVVDGLGEVEAKELLTVAAAFAAQEHIELRRRSPSNRSSLTSRSRLRPRPIRSRPPE